jgi:hypothetical protein
LAGLALIGASPLVAGCSRAHRSDLRLTDDVITAPSLLDGDRMKMLHYASLAPSGHNSQPWAVRVVSADEWIVEADPNRRLPAVDPDNREALLSIGAFVENLVIAAGAAGFICDIELLAVSPTDRDLLRVSLAPGRCSGYPLARLEMRRTVKHGFRMEPLRSPDLAFLSASLGDRLHYFPRDTQHADCLREATTENFRVQSLRDDAQRELTGWLRLSSRATRRNRDGLTVESMEIGGLAGWFVRHWSDPGDFLKPRFRQQGIDATARMAAEGGGWIVITSPGSTVADLIDTGRRFQRMALLARERGIAIHPMTQALEEAGGREQFSKLHPGGIIPQFVLRVGYLDRYPEPVSPRRPVTWFLKPDFSARTHRA